jgi:hypothetical protein
LENFLTYCNAHHYEKIFLITLKRLYRQAIFFHRELLGLSSLDDLQFTLLLTAILCATINKPDSHRTRSSYGKVHSDN